jgi:hypothetical protein
MTEYSTQANNAHRRLKITDAAYIEYPAQKAGQGLKGAVERKDYCNKTKWLEIRLIHGCVFHSPPNP